MFVDGGGGVRFLLCYCHGEDRRGGYAQRHSSHLLILQVRWAVTGGASMLG